MRIGVRVDVDGVAVLVPVRDRAAQARDALAGRVAVRVGPLRDLDAADWNPTADTLPVKFL